MNPSTCGGQNFFSFPTWYKYLSQVNNTDGSCGVHMQSIWDIWLIGAAILEMLLRIAALVAITMVVWGGIKYIQSRGDPNNIKTAQQTIISALAGLVIAVVAAAMVSFVAGSIK